jgi:hypothetical protein
MLPFHRNDRRHDREVKRKTNAPEDSKMKRFWRFFVNWVKLSWKDVLAMAVLGGAAEGVSQPIQKPSSHPI